ncbi:phage major capsid protein [Priestia megaterium]|nr:phage major capsid protein [Priestia megaterium]
MKMEIRSNKTQLSSDGTDLLIKGYVNKTGALSELLGTTQKFREKIERGAFEKALQNRSRDIELLAEHDTSKLLASTKNNSLELREDAEGLYIEAKITPTTYGRDYYEMVKSGLISSMSFGFRSLRDSWQKVEGIAIRTVHSLELYEVSIVKSPAYAQSSISARNIDLVEDVKIPEKISEYSVEKEENNNMTEMKMEQRTNDNKQFEQFLRGEIEARALVTTADGGALIPENISGTIVTKMEEVSPAFARVRKIESVAGSLKVAKENDGITGGFFGEGESIIEEALSFEEVKLTQKRLGSAISISNQLANDAGVDIIAYSQNLLSRRIAKTAEHAIFVGDGDKEFTGILKEPNIAHVDVVGAVGMDNLVELYTSIHPDFIANAAFYMNRTFFNQLAKMKDQNGHYFLQNAVVNGAINYTLLGSPVFVTEALPTTTPVIFGNITEGYTLLVKKQMSIQKIVDSVNALRGSQLLVLDAYMDGVTTNPQALAKLVVS